MNSPVIVWLRLNLRLADNPALSATAESGCRNDFENKLKIT